MLSASLNKTFLSLSLSLCMYVICYLYISHHVCFLLTGLSAGVSCEEQNFYLIGILLGIAMLIIVALLLYRNRSLKCKRLCSERISKLYLSVCCTTFSKQCPFIHAGIHRVCLCCAGSTCSKESTGTDRVSPTEQQSTPQNDCSVYSVVASNNGQAEGHNLSSIMGKELPNVSSNCSRSQRQLESPRATVVLEAPSGGQQSAQRHSRPETSPSYHSSSSHVFNVLPPPSYEQVMLNPGDYTSKRLK